MFQIKDCVIYGSNGVCIVEDICKLQLDGVSREKEYYVLQPMYKKKSKIYTPVDNSKVVMRPIISKEESEKLIDMIPAIESLEIDNSKLREEKCKTLLRTYDYKEWIRVIKTLNLRKQDRIRQGKKFYQSDEHILTLAKEYLHAELSVALKLPREKVEDYIKEKLENE